MKALSPDERELLALLLLVPEQQERGRRAARAQDRSCPARPARELLAAMLADRERDRDAGGTGSFERGRFLEALDPGDCTAWPIALYAERGPDPNELAADRVRTRRRPVPARPRGGQAATTRLRFQRAEN